MMIGEPSTTPRQCPGSIRRRWLLLCKGGRLVAGAGYVPVHRTGPAPSRSGASASAPRTHSQSIVPQGQNTPEVADQAGKAELLFARGYGRAGLRLDQAEPELPAVPVTWSGGGRRGVVADLHRAQLAQSVRYRRPSVSPAPPFQRTARAIPRPKFICPIRSSSDGLLEHSFHCV